MRACAPPFGRPRVRARCHFSKVWDNQCQQSLSPSRFLISELSPGWGCEVRLHWISLPPLPRHLLKSNAPCEDFPLADLVTLPRPSMAEGGLTSRSVNNQWRFENLTPLPGPMSPWVHFRKGLVSQSFSHIWDRSHTWVQLRGDGRYGSQERSYRRQGEDTH